VRHRRARSNARLPIVGFRGGVTRPQIHRLPRGDLSKHSTPERPETEPSGRRQLRTDLELSTENQGCTT